MYVVDTDALLEVIEETEAAKQLSLELRDRVLERLELSGMLYFLIGTGLRKYAQFCFSYF